jgi:hypothetical protein
MGIYLTHPGPPFQLPLLSPFPVSGAGDLMLGRQARGRYTMTWARLFNSRDVGSGRFSEVNVCRALLRVAVMILVGD